MLTPSTPIPTQTSVGNPRQIAAFSNVSNTVMYTVPAGKKFVGYMYGGAAASTYTVTPSGGGAVAQAAGAVALASASVTPHQLVLVAGTIITCVSVNPVYLNGVESDL